MLKRLQIVIPLLVTPLLVVGENGGTREKATTNSAAGAPKALADSQRAEYATAIARVAIAQAQMSEARAKFLEAQQQHEALVRKLRADIEKIRRDAGAPDTCELDMEGKWQCATGSR